MKTPLNTKCNCSGSCGCAYKEGDIRAMTVTKEVLFDCAHRLTFHEGKCKNLHGHTYKLQVTVDTYPAFYDFAELKQLLQTHVVNRFDHKTILESSDKNNANIASALKSAELEFIMVNYEPTAENMLKDITETLMKVCPMKLMRVRLYETPTSYAEVIL